LGAGTDSPGAAGRSDLGAGDGGGAPYGHHEFLRTDEQLVVAHTELLEPVVLVKKSSGVGRAVSLLTTCYSSSDDHEMSLSASARIEDLVPPCYIHAGNMHRLIKVSCLPLLISTFLYLVISHYCSSSSSSSSSSRSSKTLVSFLFDCFISRRKGGVCYDCDDELCFDTLVESLVMMRTIEQRVIRLFLFVTESSFSMMLFRVRISVSRVL
jgi:hypothetical protein